MAAAGILGIGFPCSSFSVYPIAPVWGEFILNGATLRIIDATAPYLAAREAPEDLYATVVE
jgi:hypothetical protein